MGSNVMEPEDIATYANDRWKDLENLTTICMSLGKVHGQGLFYLSNPLNSTLPLLLMQFSLASLSILFTFLLLKPLHQSIFVAQTLGGIILGPSLLGRSKTFIANAFPLRGFILLDLLSAIGFTFYFFLVGVRLDPRILNKIKRKTFAIGTVTVVVPIILTEFFTFVMLTMVNIDIEPFVARLLPVLAQAQCVLASPTIAFLLTELKIINSEFGRVAMCSSTVSGLLSFIITTSMVLAGQSLHDNYLLLTTLIAGSTYTIFIIFIIRPGVIWMLRRNPIGAPMKQSHFITLLVVILLTGFCSQASGLHLYYGPIILGLTIPSGPPIGSALVEKLEFITYWMFLPFFFLKNGLVIDVFNISLKNYMILQSLGLIAAVGKFVGAFVCSLYYKIPKVDALALGLLMTTQGLLEIGLFKMMKKNKVVNTESFSITCISMLIITGCVTPIIRRLYDPSRRYVVYKRRTMINAKPDSELQVLVCLHDQDNAPPAINLLEALNPTVDSPLEACVLHQVKLVGRAKPLLIPQKLSEKPSSSGPSEGVFNAFRWYEQSNLDIVSVSAYIGVSPYTLMHDDVYVLALEKRTSLVIIPFHNRFNANDASESSQKAALRIMNENVLKKAPCSVAILVDRGLLRPSRTTLGSWSPYRVGVVFLGGDDDREALAIGMRMAEHPNISLTLIRLVGNGNVTGNDMEERRLDNEFLSEFRQAMASNYRVTYIEEVIMDGSGTVAVIRSMENDYQLVLVGRSHDRRSPLLSGLGDCSERSELGAIGEIFVSADTNGNAMILVVQQHNKLENEGSGSRKQSHGDPNSVKDDEEEMPIQGRSA